MTATAQETNEIGQLKIQLRQMQEDFEKVRRQQQEQIEALTKKLDELTKTQNLATPIVAVPKNDEQKKLEAELAAELGNNSATNPIPVDSVKPAWAPTEPIRVAGSGSSYLNLSLDGLFAAGGSTSDEIPGLQLGGHDPNQRGFTVQNVEAVLEGFVDPYLRGQANIVYQITAVFFIDSFRYLDGSFKRLFRESPRIFIRDGNTSSRLFPN